MKPASALVIAPFLLAMVIDAAAADTVPDWTAAHPIAVDLSNFRFAPDHLTLRHGQPYVLHIVNHASGAHDFSAQAFFAGAQVAPADRAAVRGGRVELAGGETVDIHLIAPAVGTYDLHCDHFMHTAFGMKGTIQID